MKERLMILGAGVMQGPAIRIAKEMGLFTIAVDADPGAPCVDLADRFEQIDLKDKEGIEALGRSLRRQEGGLGGIMTAGTDFSATVAWAAERLGLPGIPYEAALNASDKERMRRCFKNAALPSPEFTILSAVPPRWPPASGALAGYPLVVKPVDNMGGRGCRRADCFAELRAAVEDALSFSRSGRAIVEAFMAGPEFSVDAIVYGEDITICGLADRHIFFPPYFIEMGHTMPTVIETARQEEILETFRAGIRALGIAGPGHAGAAKGDVKLGPSGPMIGEIAARLSGGYMSGWTYPYASGVEPVRGAILACLGRKPEGLAPRKHWTSAERAFISIPGTVRAVYGTEAARQHPQVKDLFFRVAPGSRVTFPENNVTKCGNVITAAPDRERAVEAAEQAARSILIRLEPGDEETGAFLAGWDSPAGAAGSTTFPPDAFSLTAELRALLTRLPEGRAAAEQAAGEPAILAFPEFAAAGLRDYMGRTVAESLAAVRLLTGLSLPLTEVSSDNKTVLGRSFWAALVRGGYQGAAYFIDGGRAFG
ncbi:MAG: ATP-grasp domain-containing protein [Treponema sp.]|jgi:biotin carboxylase|nr:ATP-grasp domain-containing protein [Treponema sp.]